MLSKFQEHIRTHFPDLLEDPFLLACSGGLDSVVLAYLCEQSGLDFAIAHCHFGLRKKEADLDADFVEKLANELNKKYYVKYFNTNKYAIQNKVSIQVAARDLRYTWFDQIRVENELQYTVTAHHLDDELETFLINLSRGTGLLGLAGIPAKTNTLARPLLIFSRAEIHAYAIANNWNWREDASNTDPKYLRNKIRHQIVPKLKELNPSFLENFMRTQQHLAGSNRILQDYFDSLRSELFEQEGSVQKIAVAPLRKLQPLQDYLFGLLSPYGFTEWEDVTDLLNSMPGKTLYSKTHRLVKDRDHLLLEALERKDNEIYGLKPSTKAIITPFHMTIEEVDKMGETAKKILYVDKETLKEGLHIRKWKKGDYFYPLGLKGRKKLAKYFKDEKMHVISKEEQWLLCSGDDIVWVVGKRPDERFKVKSGTKKILKFTITE